MSPRLIYLGLVVSVFTACSSSNETPASKAIPVDGPGGASVATDAGLDPLDARSEVDSRDVLSPPAPDGLSGPAQDRAADRPDALDAGPAGVDVPSDTDPGDRPGNGICGSDEVPAHLAPGCGLSAPPTACRYFSMDACRSKVACSCAGRIVVGCDYITESFAYFMPLRLDGTSLPGAACDPNDPRQGRDVDSGAPDADARSATVGSSRLVFVEQGALDIGIVDCPPPTRSATVRNLGTAPSGVVTASLEDATGQPFEIVQNGCGSTGIDAGGSCVITLRVAPPLTGRPGAATLVVAGSLGGRAVISVRSTPSFGGDLTLVPTSHSFGSVMIGATSAPIRISLTVSGPSPGTITQVTLAGVNAADYRIVDKEGCAGRLLQPGGNCGVEVVFTPSATNLRNASLLVNAGWGPPEYQCNGIGASTLSGTGVAP